VSGENRGKEWLRLGVFGAKGGQSAFQRGDTKVHVRGTFREKRDSRKVVVQVARIQP